MEDSMDNNDLDEKYKFRLRLHQAAEIRKIKISRLTNAEVIFYDKYLQNPNVEMKEF